MERTILHCDMNNFYASVEPYGMDECWLDVSGSGIYGTGYEIADRNDWQNMKEAIKMEEPRKKVYVAVNLDVGIDGRIRPRFIHWEDGMVYEVDRVKDIRRAASTKVGGCGIRYTISVCGKDTYLFNEDDKWFVEARV